MRRNDDGHVQRPPPFRVLAAPTRDTNYLSPSAIPPPPPRAPEPYKIAPTSTSYARAHRRSSFVIIAESRPSTPDERSSSPTLATGRVSPFRGRGFKGPPPRSKSRPQSPDNTDGRRRSRLDRRVSVSQQNSPRRSLIPQPTRQRSTSLTKTGGRQSSPKIGRRVDSRTRLNVSDSRNRLNSSSNNNSTTNLSTRRQLGKVSAKLSPIQGTPTKPEKTGQQSTRRDRVKETTRISPTKARQTISPTKNTNAKKVSQEKSSSRERLMSPSKIPLKNNRNGTMSLNPARFITIPNQPIEKGAKKVDKESRATKNDDESMKESKQTGNQSEGNSKDSQVTDKSSSKTNKASELDLVDLLKRSSNAIGTSSVVNTTTATAVQPLHIDANTVLIGKDDKRNPSETKNQTNASNNQSSNSSASNNDTTSMKKVQSVQDNIEDQRQPTSQVSSKPPKPTTNYNRTKSTSDSRNNSPVPTESVSGHSKNSSISQSVKNFTRTNSNQNGTGSATQRSSKNQSTPNDQNAKSFKSNDQKPSEDSRSMQSAPSSSTPKPTENNSINESNRNPTKSNANGEQINPSGSALVNKPGDFKGFGDSKGSKLNDTETKVSSGKMAATNSASMSQVMNFKTNSVPVNSAVVNDPQNVKSAGGRVRNENRESNVSLKSSAGVSTNSIESIRSTDTGVSVNTVRGVSSPREKTGVHVVKRTQEIETLSGNVMHLEQNGEPAVLAVENGVEEQLPERLLTRWKKSLGRYCECCPSMRCLACRRDPKGLSWPKKHAKIITTAKRNEVPLQEDAAAETAPTGCWTKFKSRCRCNRLREIKCCSRKARVAPAEATVCCPPERRFSAICRRLFDRCKCRRAETERTRSIRAKHSLTSVAPPPLSEEPKCKIPDVLVEHNSLMRGAIPCLPVPLAWFCLVWNVLLPGSGTVWSGIYNLCTGQPRFSPVASLKSRLGAFVVNLVVGVGQLFTVLFCLVGWGWSIWWGVTLIRLARKYKRFKASEAANNDPEARGGDETALPPGVPSQALRGMERAR